MRRFICVAVAALSLTNQPAFAQGWAEYVNSEEHFSINFPGDPAVTETEYSFVSGHTFPARSYTASDGSGAYSLTVVHYDNAVPALREALIALAAETVRRRGGEITYDDIAVYDGMDTQMMQIDNTDATRSYIAIMKAPESAGLNRLLIGEGRVAMSAPVPGHFQQSLSVVDSMGERMRYSTDIEGTKFRVIPGSGGEPLLREECAPGLPCPDPQ
jgi:hypothetical protein